LNNKLGTIFHPRLPPLAEIPDYNLATRGRIDKELAEFFFTEYTSMGDEIEVLFKGTLERIRRYINVLGTIGNNNHFACSKYVLKNDSWVSTEKEFTGIIIVLQRKGTCLSFFVVFYL
jgi:hypothetical protein